MRQRHPRPPAERAERTRVVGATSSKSFMAISTSCANIGDQARTVIASEAKQSILALPPYGLLRFARNDEISIRRHAPRRRGIQYAVPSVWITDGCVYWIIRFRG
jgi:hypothetical protein